MIVGFPAKVGRRHHSAFLFGYLISADNFITKLAITRFCYSNRPAKITGLDIQNFILFKISYNELMVRFLKTKTIAVLILIVCLFLILNCTGLTKEIRSFFYSISAPIQKNLWQKGNEISNFFDSIIKARSLEEQNRKLLSDNQKLLSENLRLKDLEKENKILRQALGVGLQKDFKLVMAEIISKDVFQDVILVNKGSRQGVSKGMPVVTHNKALCGRIEKVYDNFSEVMLISNPKSIFDAKIQTQNEEIYGVVKGRGNLNLYFDLVPQDKEIKKQDIVVTTSLGGIFPKGLLVGQVKEVKKDDVQPFQQVEIQPFFTFRDTEILFVITEY